MFQKAANSSALTPIRDGDCGSLRDFLTRDGRESCVGVHPDKEGLNNCGRAIHPSLLNGNVIYTHFHSISPNSQFFLDSSSVSVGARNYLQDTRHVLGVLMAGSSNLKNLIGHPPLFSPSLSPVL
ncbi:hypothetical protein SUGI_1105060 [Cryptomeria japonica]|nr:hypothetical protein SUGI_1105060 [Cryptomeria japonica]